MTKPAPFSLLLAGLLLPGCTSRSAPAAKYTAPPLSVQTAVTNRREVSRILELPGDVRARRSAKIYSKVSGYLKELRVDIGDRVQAGQVLAVLDAPELEREASKAQAEAEKAHSDTLSLQSQQSAQSQLSAAAGSEMERARSQARASQAQRQEAEASYRFRSDSYRRLKAVYDEDHGLIARQLLDQSWSEVKLSQGQLAAARETEKAAQLQARGLERRQAAAQQQEIALGQQALGSQSSAQARLQEVLKAQDWRDYTLLRAPFAGVVSQRYLDRGALMANASQPVLEVVDERSLTVVLRIPEMEAPSVKPGRALEFSSEALPKEKFNAHITRVGHALRSESDRTMQAEADFANADFKLQPGMFVHCFISLESHPNTLAVPSSAVLDEKGKTSVFLVEQGKAKKKPVKIGFKGPRFSEVLEGLSGGESVISKGKEAVTDGAMVKVESP